MRRLICILMVFVLCFGLSLYASAEGQSGQDSADSYGYDGWVVECTQHIRFHFHPSFTAKQRESFEKTREEAFVSVNSFFNSSLPNLIDFYVWDSNESGQKILGHTLGFSIPESEVIHSTYHQFRGHELTHVISYWYYPSGQKTAFLNEGTAVYFNLSGDVENEREKQLQNDIRYGGKDKFNLPDIWNYGTTDTKLLKMNQDAYTIGGAFVRYLIENGGKEDFLKLMGNQTYTGAREIYGDKLDQYINGFQAQFAPDTKGNAARWRAVVLVNVLLASIICVLVYRKQLAEWMTSLPSHSKK